MSIEKYRNPLTVDEQIDEIWRTNSKIPFMQSKEILSLGYRLGLEKSKEVKKEEIKKVESKKEEPKKEAKNERFVGTSKEFIEDVSKEVKNRMQNNKTQSKFGPKDSNTIYVKTSELDIENAKLILLNGLSRYISETRDLLATYNKIIDLQTDTEKKIKSLSKKVR